MATDNNKPDEPEVDSTYKPVGWDKATELEARVIEGAFLTLGIDPECLKWLKELHAYAQGEFCGPINTLGMMLQAAIVNLYGSMARKIMRAKDKR